MEEIKETEQKKIQEFEMFVRDAKSVEDSRKKNKKRNLKGKQAEKDLKRTCQNQKCPDRKTFTWRETGKYNQHFCSLDCANEFASEYGGGGRPTAWRPEYNNQIIKYFSIDPYIEVVDTVTYKDGEKYIEKFKRVPNDLPLFEGFAETIKITPKTLLEWAKDENKRKYPGFSEAYGICKAIQHRILVVGTLNGLYNSGFAQFLAKNITDLKDKQEHELSGPGGQPITYQVML